MRDITYIGNRIKWLGGLFTTLGIPTGAVETYGESDPADAHLFFNTTTGKLMLWDPISTTWIAVGDNVFDIINIGVGSPNPAFINTIQVKSNGEVFFVDKDGDIQQIEFVPVDSVKINKLLPADATNTIANAAFLQEWQWALTTGGKALRLNNTRVGTTGTTEEILLELVTGGNDQAPRPVKTLRIQNSSRIPPNKTAGLVTAVEIVMDGTMGGSGQAGLNKALVITSNFKGIECITQEDAIFGRSSAGYGGLFRGPVAITITPTETFAQPSLVITGTNTGTAILVQMSSGNPIAFEIPPTAPARVVLQTSTDVNNRRSILSIGGSTIDRASLNIEAGVAPSAPVDGEIWRTATHLYIRLGGVTYQLDQQAVGGADESIYSTDGALPELRTVDMDSFTLIFDNSGLFRIRDVGSDTGIYDFFEGIDFIIANTTKSYSITKDLPTGIKLTSIDNIGTTNDTKEIVVDNTQIKLDSPVVKVVNIPNHLDNAAAITAGLANDTIFRDDYGFIRSKQASVIDTSFLLRQKAALPAGDSVVNVTAHSGVMVDKILIKSDTNSPGVTIGFSAGTNEIMVATDLVANQWEIVSAPFVLEADTDIHISDIVGNGNIIIFKAKL